MVDSSPSTSSVTVRSSSDWAANDNNTKHGNNKNNNLKPDRSSIGQHSAHFFALLKAHFDIYMIAM